MNLKFIKRSIVVATLLGTILVPQLAVAEINGLNGIAKQENAKEIDSNCLVNAIADIQKEENSEKTIKIESTEEIKFQGMVNGKNFVTIMDGHMYVLETADVESDWVGKVYANSVVKITERGQEWSKIESGEVVGYVKTDDLITGKDAVAYVKNYLEQTYVGADVYTLTQEQIDGAFSVGETREAEEARLAAEEEARIAAEQARIEAEKEASRQKGIEIVNYAKQFIGNPYVYGGTSLTRGTDCSGFVKGVYKHFGVSLPRTSSAMRSVGRAVSYSEMQVGDIVCYSGHVGIYAGNGKIVNAIDEKRGINLSNATYKKIITIRRIF